MSGDGPKGRRSGRETESVVTSLRNPRVLAARRLLRRSERSRTGAFLVEGPIPAHEAIRAGDIEQLFVDAEAPFAEEWLGRGALAVSRRVMAALSDTSTPQGVVAVARMHTVSLSEVAGDLVVVLSEVRDPGNAGTLIRSAVAAGAGAVIFCPGSVDPFNSKTVRATAGLLFHVDVVAGVALADAANELGDKGFRMVGADATSTRSPEEIDLVAPVAIVLGNESWGLEASARALLDEEVGIPMPGPAESLNVGIAGSILLFEAVRQRRSGGAEHKSSS
ncbi:MAG: TrmH family RNA methyltransferase [Actinomycetota bacterium]